MRDVEKKQIISFLLEFQKNVENDLHQRILTAAIDKDEDFIFSMEVELGNYLLEVLNYEDK